MASGYASGVVKTEVGESLSGVKTVCRIGLFAGALAAAPALRLSNAVVGGTIAVGSSAAPRTLEACNIGDGTLSSLCGFLPQ